MIRSNTFQLALRILTVLGLAVVMMQPFAWAQTATRRSGGAATKQPEPAKAPARPVAEAASPKADAASAATIPPVLMTKLETSKCTVKVGDALPVLKLKQLGGADTDLASRYGNKATVVAFWKTDRRMTSSLLGDLGPDVVEKFGSQGVNVIGIAVEPMSDKVSATIEKTAARFTNLIDAEGKAFAQVGSDKLPRVYLVDAQGKILWFDIEYSLTTRRELNQALRAVVGRESASK